MSAAKRHAREREAPAPSTDETRCAWALWPAKGGGWQWCRVLLPLDVLEAHQVGLVEPANIKGIALSKIELDMQSERVIDRRGWER